MYRYNEHKINSKTRNNYNYVIVNSTCIYHCLGDLTVEKEVSIQAR